MARFTGLAGRAHDAGITTVFPDGWKGFWHQLRPPDRQPNLDDARFLAELSVHLEGQGVARSWPVYLAGISNGARFAEHVARHGQLAVSGLFVVVGSALEVSRRVAPVPAQRLTVVMIMGTGDRTTPYDGGPLIRHGLTGLVRKRRAVRHGEQQGEDVIAAAETVACDWASGNGISSGPAFEELPAQPDDPPVTRMTWTALPSGEAVPGGRRRARVARRATVPSGEGRRADPPASGRDGHAARDGGRDGGADDRILGPSGSG